MDSELNCTTSLIVTLNQLSGESDGGEDQGKDD